MKCVLEGSKLSGSFYTIPSRSGVTFLGNSQASAPPRPDLIHELDLAPVDAIEADDRFAQIPGGVEGHEADRRVQPRRPRDGVENRSAARPTPVRRRRSTDCREGDPGRRIGARAVIPGSLPKWARLALRKARAGGKRSTSGAISVK